MPLPASLYARTQTDGQVENLMPPAAHMIGVGGIYTVQGGSKK